MKIIDPGHRYELKWLDSDDNSNGELWFVKREGDKYPGNIGHHPGTNIQEVLRVLIDRVKYLHHQNPHRRNPTLIEDLRNAIYQLEMRAAEKHDRCLILDYNIPIEEMLVCIKCGHIGCIGECK